MSTEISISTPPIDSLQSPLLLDAGITLNVLRLDKIHPLLSGNKWYKLKYNLLEFQQKRELPILSFGGAYSNHLYALAAAGKILGMKTIGVIRGELPSTGHDPALGEQDRISAQAADGLPRRAAG